MTFEMLAALVLSQSATAPVLVCGALPITDDVACAQNAHGVVVADDQATADRFAAVAAAGEDRFRKAFGREPQPYAVLLGERVNPMNENGETASVEWQTRLRAAGAEHVLPWLTDGQRDLAMGRSGEGLPVGEDSAVAHELGHMWAKSVFWPDFKRSLGDTPIYGSPAPDWFDETSAVLMEDSSLTRTRTEGFLREWKSATGLRPKPLADFFQDTHPLFRPSGGSIVRAEDLPPGAQLIAGSPPQGAGPQRFTMTRASPSGRLGNAASAGYFYAQVQLLADFLLEASQDPMLFGRLAEAHAQNRTMDEWLSSEGRNFGLPDTVAGLDARFGAWLTERYGPAA